MPLRGYTPPSPSFALVRKAGAGTRPNRAPRRPIAGAAHLAQTWRLLFSPQYGKFGAYHCRVANIANGGYCITLVGPRCLPPDYLVGMDAFLEHPDQTLMPVELRWIKGPKIGLKRLPRGRAW